MLDAQNEQMSRLKGKLVEKDQRIDGKNREIATLSREMEKLETKMQLLKIDSRVAEISVLDQRNDQQSGKLITTITFRNCQGQSNPGFC